MTLSKVFRVRLQPNDLFLLDFLEKKTGLKKSSIMRLALRDFYYRALKDEGLAKDVRKELLYRVVNEKLREIKRFRWLYHVKMTAINMLEDFEQFKKDLETGRVKVREPKLALRRADMIIQKELELIELISELEGLELES